MLQFNRMKNPKRSKSQPRPHAPRVHRRTPSKIRTEADRIKRRKIADAVRLHIEEKGISRPKLEEMVGRGESTMNHFFAGDFSDLLLRRVEHVLDRSFGGSSSVAPVEWGEYTQEGTEKFVGTYVTLRCDFADPKKICAYVTSIEWAEIKHAHIFDGVLVRKPNLDGHGLIFREERRSDQRYSHRGQVWFAGGTVLYLVTAYGDGRLRAAITSLPDNGRMAGIQLSLYNPKGPAFAPAASPIVFLRREKIEDTEIGTITDTHAHYQDYRRELDEALANDIVFASS